MSCAACEELCFSSDPEEVGRFFRQHAPHNVQDDGRARRMRNRLIAWGIVALILGVMIALSGCASKGRYVPIPDPQDGKVYGCCWYPHGYSVWVPEGQAGPSYLRGPWLKDTTGTAVMWTTRVRTLYPNGDIELTERSYDSKAACLEDQEHFVLPRGASGSLWGQCAPPSAQK
jgi:hypothetical protein